MMVKICGITRREDAEAAVEAGASAIGFVFAVPLLLLCAYPSTRVVDAIRERLESGGVSAQFGGEPSHLP